MSLPLHARRKLADTRSMDGSTTLVHYLTALMLDSAPGVRCGAVLPSVLMEGRKRCAGQHACRSLVCHVRAIW